MIKPFSGSAESSSAAAPSPAHLQESAVVVDISRVVVAPHESRPIPPRDVLALYQTQAWWSERTIEQISTVLTSTPSVGAWHNDELVGFARAVTDGLLRAYVEDVFVSPQLRGTGVGHTLMSRLLEQLRPIPIITLFCSVDLVSFYESTGFRPTKQVVLHRSD